MSSKILKALMQLFAIMVNTERLTAQGRNIVQSFLQQQLSHAQVAIYIQYFDEYLKQLEGKADPGKVRKRLAVNSVKVLRICTDINQELDQKQKYIVLIRLIEFVHASAELVTEQESEFLATVASVFNIKEEEYNACLSLASSHDPSAVEDSPLFLTLNSSPPKETQRAKHLINDSLHGELRILNIRSAGILFVKYFGTITLTLNGQPLLSGTVYVLSQGSVIRGVKVHPIYYSDVLRCFLKDEIHEEVTLTANNLEYHFRSGKKGLNRINLSASSGNLIGIMGGSGAGKSTLLNVLNSNLRPSDGTVKINGVNVHMEKEKLEGVIGHVPQDDLLIEDLTVFQNLYYSTKLCFGELSDEDIRKKVEEQLEALGLATIKDLRVGDVLNQTISGGQRKRLNIALELIRRPKVLFVDEPTSGLSSTDSENVMDLLKQLSAEGNLVLVVIHQPSSDIFKLFDKLIILDAGGYQVYYGNPADSLIYFKHRANYAGADESECITCGNINPEQIFSILESKVIDEFGNETQTRRILPKEWNEWYKENLEHAVNGKLHENGTPVTEAVYKKPSRFRQLQVFISRDLLAKFRNTQYLLINFLEAPVLAFILSYFLKYSEPGSEYVFRKNLNLPVFIFISVIVALFMGLTVSAEEIIRDRKILKREAFLNLSHNSYLLSKIFVMFLISAIQTFSFVVIGSTVFGILDLTFDYWLIIFSVSCTANLLGLNISAALNSAVTIYILIPFLIIPQIIFSGVMVKFQNLNPSVTSQSEVPAIGEIMVSRWGFEALAVNEFANNRYKQNFFAMDKEMSNATYKKDFWLIKMNDLIDSVHAFPATTRSKTQLDVFQNELEKEILTSTDFRQAAYPQNLSIPLDESTYKNVKGFLESLRKDYIRRYNRAATERESMVQQLSKSIGEKGLSILKDDHTNEKLDNLLLNEDDFNPIIEYRDQFIRRFRPVYMEGTPNSFIRAPFYVSKKYVFGNSYNTYGVNLVVIWLMTLLLALTLYFDLLKKCIVISGNLFGRLKSLFRTRSNEPYPVN